MKKRIGMYAWGGPGTIRLLRTKYHQPKIDEKSFLSLYEEDYWRKAKDLFGVTDAWLTYSWGFSDEREREDYTFIQSKLPTFKKLKIACHGYVQGFNVVTADFSGQDIFCVDAKGHVQPYSKGRSLTCPNNPQAAKIILDRVKRACQEDFSSIFIDNIIFGLPPMYVSQDFVPFYGCACSYCQDSFYKTFHYPLPISGFSAKTIKDFLFFRSMSTQNFLRKAHQLTQKFHKQLGVNLYDPFIHAPELFFGYSLQKIEPFLDYLLIENHAHPARVPLGNSHLLQFIQRQEKTVFVVSYKNGIGFEEQFTQHDIDSIFSESSHLSYAPCLKTTEFTTRGEWHALRLADLKKPKLDLKPVRHALIKNKAVPQTSFLQKKIAMLEQNHAAVVLNLLYENRWLDFCVRKLGFYQKQLWSIKDYNLD